MPLAFPRQLCRRHTQAVPEPREYQRPDQHHRERTGAVRRQASGRAAQRNGGAEGGQRFRPRPAARHVHVAAGHSAEDPRQYLQGCGRSRHHHRVGSGSPRPRHRRYGHGIRRRGFPPGKILLPLFRQASVQLFADEGRAEVGPEPAGPPERQRLAAGQRLHRPLPHAQPRADGHLA